MSLYVGKHCIDLPGGGYPMLDSLLGRGWYILRHGGESHHTWYLRGPSCPRSKAERIFDRMVSKMRRGSLALIDSDGVVRRYEWAPR